MLFPDNKKFAFTILDDADRGTVENLRPIYGLLDELGMKTTLAVWPLANAAEGKIPAGTLQDADYLQFCRELEAKGFEIALHSVRNHDARRELVEQGLKIFRELMHHDPIVHCNHATNLESLYWGKSRFSSAMNRAIYGLMTFIHGKSRVFEGHLEDSPFFWGDLCKEHIKYVRGFTFNDINLLKHGCLPYHDPARPFVNYWFSTAEAGIVRTFREMICEENQDRLEAEGGICILSTHFGKKFTDGKTVHPQIEALLRRLARKNGWFVPVKDVLEYMQTLQRDPVILPDQLCRLEFHWLFQQLYARCRNFWNSPR